MNKTEHKFSIGQVVFVTMYPEPDRLVIAGIVFDGKDIRYSNDTVFDEETLLYEEKYCHATREEAEEALKK